MLKNIRLYYQNRNLVKNSLITKRSKLIGKLAKKSILLGLFTISNVIASQSVFAVETCEALTLYGNAINTKLCKSLSPGNQNLWVCELTNGNPDIHTTFNATTPLHITVRNRPTPPGCEGASTLGGTWPEHLTVLAGQPGQVCNVSIDNYVLRLNSVPQVAHGNTTLCRKAFLTAGENMRIGPALMQQYLDLCNANACP